MEMIKPFAEGLSLSLKLRTFPLCYLCVCKYAWFVCCVYAYEFTYIVCVCVCVRARLHMCICTCTFEHDYLSERGFCD